MPVTIFSLFSCSFPRWRLQLRFSLEKTSSRDLSCLPGGVSEPRTDGHRTCFRWELVATALYDQLLTRRAAAVRDDIEPYPQIREESVNLPLFSFVLGCKRNWVRKRSHLLLRSLATSIQNQRDNCLCESQSSVVKLFCDRIICSFYQQQSKLVNGINRHVPANIHQHILAGIHAYELSWQC